MSITFSTSQIQNLKKILIFGLNYAKDPIKEDSFKLYEYIRLVEKKQKTEVMQK